MPSSFDAAAKEAQLLEEADGWDTTAPVPARPGDVPVIDVGPYFETGGAAELAAAAEQLRTASEEVGFHQLVGHGLGPDAFGEILDTARRFHALPMETKREILMDRPDWPVGGVGYLPVGTRKLPRRSRGNENEAFLIKSVEENQWLPDAALPGFRHSVETYLDRITDVAMRLLPVYAAALDLEPDFFNEAFADPFWRLRLTHYPPSGARQHDDAFGIAPHVDTTFFTLLLSDGPGLCIFSHARQTWIEVPAVADALIVNSGELLKQWSNDRFLSTRHFATNPASGHRYSVPLFFNANADWPMACLPSCHGPGNPPKYATVSYRESQAAVQGE